MALKYPLLQPHALRPAEEHVGSIGELSIPKQSEAAEHLGRRGIWLDNATANIAPRHVVAKCLFIHIEDRFRGCPRILGVGPLCLTTEGARKFVRVRSLELAPVHFAPEPHRVLVPPDRRVDSTYTPAQGQRLCRQFLGSTDGKVVGVILA